MKQGFLSIILHAHLPYVRHPEHESFFEEMSFFKIRAYIQQFTILYTNAKATKLKTFAINVQNSEIYSKIEKEVKKRLYKYYPLIYCHPQCTHAQLEIVENFQANTPLYFWENAENVFDDRETVEFINHIFRKKFGFLATN